MDALEKPRGTSAMIDLSAEDLGLVNEMDAKVGSRVRIVLYGIVQGVSKSAGDPTEEGGGSGHLTINVSNMKLASNNEIAELFDEEFDG